jgi:hypothetical protein
MGFHHGSIPFISQRKPAAAASLMSPPDEISVANLHTAWMNFDTFWFDLVFHLHTIYKEPIMFDMRLLTFANLEKCSLVDWTGRRLTVCPNSSRKVIFRDANSRQNLCETTFPNSAKSSSALWCETAAPADPEGLVSWLSRTPKLSISSWSRNIS